MKRLENYGLKTLNKEEMKNIARSLTWRRDTIGAIGDRALELKKFCLYTIQL